MTPQQDEIINKLMDRSVDVLANTYFLLYDMERRHGRRLAARMAEQWLRTNGMPMVNYKQFVECLEAAGNRRQITLNAHIDQPTKVIIPQDEIGFYTKR